MAYENVQFAYSNFCFGALLGTYCSLDTTNVTAVLRTRNDSGSNVGTQYTFNPTITQSVSVGALDYTGPRSLGASQMKNGLPFFTMERTSSSGCTIKHWLLDVTNGQVDIYNTITKTTSAPYYFNCYTMAIEYHHTTFASSTTSGTGYVDVSSAAYMEVGDTLLLGPSTDTTNLDAYEYVDITSISGSYVYLTASGITPTQYEYASSDKITFYKNIFLFSDTGQNNASDKGSLYQLNVKTGAIIDVQDSGLYSGVRAASWSLAYEKLAFVKSTNIIYLDTSVSGAWDIFKSQNMANVNADRATVLPVYDLAFNGNDIYRLQDKTTRVNDAGLQSTTTWTTYNYHQDTLAPYTKNIDISADPDGVVLNDEALTLTVVVRDQFGVGLLSKTVYFFDSPDADGYFDPIGGTAITNASGIASITYHTNYFNPTGGGRIRMLLQ